MTTMIRIATSGRQPSRAVLAQLVEPQAIIALWLGGRRFESGRWLDFKEHVTVSWELLVEGPLIWCQTGWSDDQHLVSVITPAL